MNSWEMRELIKGNKRRIRLSEEMTILIRAFEQKTKDMNLSKEDYFYAGYILSNPIARENLVKNYKEMYEIEQKRN